MSISAELLVFLLVGITFVIAYNLYKWIKNKVDP